MGYNNIVELVNGLGNCIGKVCANGLKFIPGSLLDGNNHASELPISRPQTPSNDGNPMELLDLARAVPNPQTTSFD